MVWPEIWRMVETRVAEAHASGHAVCVVDAAVLLQAGWQDHVHEVWVTIAPVKEVRGASFGIYMYVWIFVLLSEKWLGGQKGIGGCVGSI